MQVVAQKSRSITLPLFAWTNSVRSGYLMTFTSIGVVSGCWLRRGWQMPPANNPNTQRNAIAWNFRILSSFSIEKGSGMSGPLFHDALFFLDLMPPLNRAATRLLPADFPFASHNAFLGRTSTFFPFFLNHSTVFKNQGICSFCQSQSPKSSSFLCETLSMILSPNASFCK